jgi:hypothetical protein
MDELEKCMQLKKTITWNLGNKIWESGWVNLKKCDGKWNQWSWTTYKLEEMGQWMKMVKLNNGWMQGNKAMVNSKKLKMMKFWKADSRNLNNEWT